MRVYFNEIIIYIKKKKKIEKKNLEYFFLAIAHA